MKHGHVTGTRREPRPRTSTKRRYAALGATLAATFSEMSLEDLQAFAFQGVHKPQVEAAIVRTQALISTIESRQHA